MGGEKRSADESIKLHVCKGVEGLKYEGRNMGGQTNQRWRGEKETETVTGGGGEEKTWMETELERSENNVCFIEREDKWKTENERIRKEL